MARELEVIKEFDRSWMGEYTVQRQYHGWDWRDESSWDTKAAAYYAAESLSRVTEDSTRVVKFL